MSQENLQTMIMQNFWGLKEGYYGIVQLVNSTFPPEKNLGTRLAVPLFALINMTVMTSRKN